MDRFFVKFLVILFLIPHVGHTLPEASLDKQIQDLQNSGLSETAREQLVKRLEEHFDTKENKTKIIDALIRAYHGEKDVGEYTMSRFPLKRQILTTLMRVRSGIDDQKDLVRLKGFFLEVYSATDKLALELKLSNGFFIHKYFEMDADVLEVLLKCIESTNQVTPEQKEDLLKAARLNYQYKEKIITALDRFLSYKSNDKDRVSFYGEALKIILDLDPNNSSGLGKLFRSDLFYENFEYAIRLSPDAVALEYLRHSIEQEFGEINQRNALFFETVFIAQESGKTKDALFEDIFLKKSAPSIRFITLDGEDRLESALVAHLSENVGLLSSSQIRQGLLARMTAKRYTQFIASYCKILIEIFNGLKYPEVKGGKQGLYRSGGSEKLSQTAWAEVVRSLALEVQESSIQEKLLEPNSGAENSYKDLLAAARKIADPTQVVVAEPKKVNFFIRCIKSLVDRF